jgi:hypothetical protein
MWALSCCLVDMIRTQIQLDEEEYRRAREAAARKRLSFSAYVRESLRVALEESRRDEMRGEALMLPGKYRSGLTDLARNHDRYLSDG